LTRIEAIKQLATIIGSMLKNEDLMASEGLPDYHLT